MFLSKILISILLIGHVFSPFVQLDQPPLSIKIGIMISQNQSNPASMQSSGVPLCWPIIELWTKACCPPGTNITFIVKYEECDNMVALGYAFNMIVDMNVDALIPSPCSKTAQLVMNAATYYNIPAILWGPCFDSSFSLPGKYPTMVSSLPFYNDFGNVICSIMDFFDWNVFALIYQGNQGGLCLSFRDDLQAATNTNPNCVIGYREQYSQTRNNAVDYTISQLKSRARIVVLCFDDLSQQRQFTAELAAAGMDTEEWVYLTPGLNMINVDDSSIQPWWIDPDPQIQAGTYKIVQRAFHVKADIFGKTANTSFKTDMLNAVTGWPFFCQNCVQTTETVSKYAPMFYDSFFTYGQALSKVLGANANSSSDSNQNVTVSGGQQQQPSYRNGRLLRQSIAEINFKGMTGNVKNGKDSLRNAFYLMSAYYQNQGQLSKYVGLQVSDNGVQNVSYVGDGNKQIWSSRNGQKPLAVPLCGFTGTGCQQNFFQQYLGYLIAAVCLLCIGIFGIIFGIYYLIKMKRQEMERQNRLWQIPYGTLTKSAHNHKMNASSSIGKPMESVRSLQSGNTASSKFTRESVTNRKFNGAIYTISSSSAGGGANSNANGGTQQKVVGLAHAGIVNVRLTAQNMAELRGMRLLNADNVNRFVGLSIDGPELLSLWRYCSRGPLSEIVNGASALTMDGFFIYSLIRDVCRGLRFLHSSPLGWHGNLRSTNCLIDDRWQVKLSEYGLRFLRPPPQEKREAKELLWTAPELIREEEGTFGGNKPADIFSFAIVCAEIINMKPIWEHGNANAEEMVFLFRKGGRMPFRPRLQPSSQDLSTALLHLVKDCWCENPSDRPKVDTVWTMLQSMNTARSTNLMDHVFGMLEQYAGSLEEEVEERTKELMEEKKKSDILLYRMLPKQVADKLKLGQSVEPESFECVTVFFSDVVAFTALASKCSPLQVVNLLNNLYTLLDSIIAEFDVYKVETIGDGYLCVSGLPHPNGNAHAKHIAEMALAIMRNLTSFSIPHLPGERLRMRIGIHTGPTVAGVVGLSMPRYCLFGDTINTAARMESNSKPMRIHISSSTNHFLVNLLGGFSTQPRGEIIVKGIGVLETFWLLGHEGDSAVREFSADGQK